MVDVLVSLSSVDGVDFVGEADVIAVHLVRVYADYGS